MLACPLCTFPLSEVRNGGVTVHRCTRCGGTLVDPQASDAAYGGLGDPCTWDGEHIPAGPEARRLPCPVDGHVLATWNVQDAHHAVTVDACPTCGVLWLDPTEGVRLARIVRERSGRLPLPATPEAPAEPENAPVPGTAAYFFQLFTGMPMEVWHPTRRKPWLVYSLLVALAGIFLWELASGPAAVVEALGLHPRDVLGGHRAWTLLTSGFLHAGIVHLLGNCYFLYVFGDNVEDTLGTWGFLKVYLAAMVVGGLVHVAASLGTTLPMVGASGAIAGLMGAYLALFPKVRVYVVWMFVRFKLPVWVYLGLWLLVQVAAAAAHQQGVAWFAHLGGFATGFALGYRARGAAPGELD